MDDKFLKLLRNIDLTKDQINIYAAVMKLGMPTVFELGEYLKLNRPRIYKETKELLDKWILELGTSKPRKFLAVNPRRLKSLVEEKKESLASLEGALNTVGEYFESRERVSENDIRVKIFENRNVKKVYEYLATDAADSELFAIVGPYDYQVDYLDLKFLESLSKKYSSNNVKFQALIHPDDHNIKKYFGEKKGFYLKTMDSLDIKVTIDIWKNKMIISSFGKDSAKALLIENKLLADAYKSLFKSLWNTANG